MTKMTDVETAQAFLNDWSFWAHGAQRPPDGDWRCWLFMGGRGAGKTRAGAEWVRGQVMQNGCRRVALVGPTLQDVREVMIEGPSGLKAVCAQDGMPVYSPTRRRLEWPNGAEGFVFSAEDPDSLRGPQFDAAWCDELGAWARAEAVWDMLMFGLRLGSNPRVAATTTPRPTPLIRRLSGAETTCLTRASTRENAANLAAGFLEAVEAEYGGSMLGRQEIDGELIDDPEGALWVRSLIDQYRMTAPPDDLARVVVAVDPPASKGAKADTCGIVAAGLGADGVCVVLADASVQGLRPLDWAGRAAALAHEWLAAEIIAEANQGGEMVREVLELSGAQTPVRLAHARMGKAVRAGPVAALYAQGRVRHAGVFCALEDEMCVFGTDSAKGSPDRVDALVWAVTALKLEQMGDPRVRRV